MTTMALEMVDKTAVKGLVAMAIPALIVISTLCHPASLAIGVMIGTTVAFIINNKPEEYFYELRQVMDFREESFEAAVGVYI